MSESTAPSAQAVTWDAVKGRLLEALPGLVTWNLVLAPVWLSFTFYGVQLVAYGVLAFDCFWLFRTLSLVVTVNTSYGKVRSEMAIDWLERCRQQGPGRTGKAWEQYVHLCLIPTYTEPYHTLRATVRAIAAANFPKENKMVAIITRHNDHSGIANVQRLRQEFGESFAQFFHILDPLLPGIVLGKSAAMSYGGQWISRRLAEEGYDPECVVVTDLDADFRVQSQYFARVTHHILVDDDPNAHIFQPVPMFHNNIWRVPVAVRISAGVATQWQLFLHSRPYRLVPFSSYSLTLKMLETVGFWDDDVIPEDSRLYWKSFFKLGARLRCLPVYLPIYGDAPESRTYAATHKNQYNQIRRWAWGVTDIPYVMMRIWHHPEIPARLRLQKAMLLVGNHINWVFMPLLLAYGATLPVLANTDFSLTILGQMLTLISALILTAALISASALIVTEHRMLPAPPAHWGRLMRLWSKVQFFLYPVVGLVLGALPALDAQTRLMLGHYLEYRVTEKI